MSATHSLNDPYQALNFLCHRPLTQYCEIAVQQFMFTWGLCCDVSSDPDATPYRYRYCYPSLSECLEDFQYWDGQDHPPGNWIKRKGVGYEDLSNPDYVDHGR